MTKCTQIFEKQTCFFCLLVPAIITYGERCESMMEEWKLLLMFVVQNRMDKLTLSSLLKGAENTLNVIYFMCELMTRNV